MRSYQNRIPSLILILLGTYFASDPAFSQEAKPYFQQELQYTIAVRLDDSLHMLHGEETVRYTNNSPDTLYFIYMHLWPNAYKNNQTALAKQLVRNRNKKLQFASEEMRGWIDSLAFRDDSGLLQWHYDEEHIDICKVILRAPLLPGGSTTLHTPFTVKLPGDFSRLGHVGKSYQISQWYPKPAVYDREGWHAMPYLDLGEFYSEYGSFEVKITLPATYRVAATGVLQETQEKNWLNTLSEQAFTHFPVGDSISEWDKDRIGKSKTITFKQDLIHDFAFFCAKNYVVRKDIAVLGSGKNVETWAFFRPDTQSAWKQGAFYVKRAVEAYSEWVGDYPYEAATAVEGALSAGGGMEYPMVTVISAASDAEGLDNVITHEVGHNWFYGILGSNEREYAWMDEGFNTHVEERYMSKYYPGRKLADALGIPVKLDSAYDHHWGLYLMSTIHSSYGYQYPINTPSIEMPLAQYALLSYQRTAFLLNYLSAYLGQETFDACMHRYYEVWQFKHPQPKDVQNVFESVSGKKLDWFFESLFNTEQQFDYSLSRLKKQEHSFVVTVKNRGTIPAPYPVYLLSGDSVIKTLWMEGHTGITTVHVPRLDADRIVMDHVYLSPDLSLRNNRIRTSGLFKRSEPLRIKLMPGFGRNDGNALRVHPSIGYNTADGLMLGVILHNYDIQGKKFSYFINPMYGLVSETFAGSAMLKYDWFVRDRSLRKVRLMAQYKRFAGYDKVEPSLNFFFHTGKIQHKKHLLSLSWAHISHRDLETRFFPSSYASSRIRYNRTKTNAILKEKISGGFMYANGVGIKHWRIEATYQRTDQLTKKSKLKSRVYGGWINGLVGTYFSLYSAGSPDVNKDYYLIDRVGNQRAAWLGTNQALMDQGGFMSFNMRADSYLASVNLEYQYRWFFHPYVTGLMVDEFLYYETGLGVSLGVLDVYFPISSNAYVDGFPENGKQWGESVRFTLNQNLGNFWNMLEIQF